MADDWNTTTVIGSRRNQTGGGGNKEKQLNIARRQGMQITTDSKYGAGGNTQKVQGTGLNTAKLDAETEELKHKTVDMSIGKIIQQGRQAKEMTQKELATKMNEKPQVVIEYEQGKAIPNQAILAKMERVLGIKLRGKDKGQPLEAKKK